MSDLATLTAQMQAQLGAAAQFWPGKTPKLDDMYEAYLWSETIDVARNLGWTVAFVNAGAANDTFTFRRGPGLITSSTPYTYAEISNGGSAGELHVGIRVSGRSTTLHEFDVLGLDQSYRRHGGSVQPSYGDVRLHIEAKFHASDLSLGVGRALVGLGLDCPGIEPFLVARNEGSATLRPFIKHYLGHFVHKAFPGDTGVAYFRTCIAAALKKW